MVLPTLPPTPRAGFARQGAKEKQLLKEGNAFNVSSFVLRAMMSGQYWPEGDEVYHAELTVPVLLVHGMHDKFVPVEEDQRMAEVWHSSHHTPQIPPAQPRGALCSSPRVEGESLELRLRVKGGIQKVGLPGTGGSDYVLSPLPAKRHSSPDFPGGPVVSTSHFHCRGHGFDPSLGN